MGLPGSLQMSLSFTVSPVLCIVPKATGGPGPGHVRRAAVAAVASAAAGTRHRGSGGNGCWQTTLGVFAAILHTFGPVMPHQPPGPCWERTPGCWPRCQATLSHGRFPFVMNCLSIAAVSRHRRNPATTVASRRHLSMLHCHHRCPSPPCVQAFTSRGRIK